MVTFNFNKNVISVFNATFSERPQIPTKDRPQNEMFVPGMLSSVKCKSVSHVMIGHALDSHANIDYLLALAITSL
jgi:hypothetical protein